MFLYILRACGGTLESGYMESMKTVLGGPGNVVNNLENIFQEN
jgi:hypothetical protein